jgi:hypothetical protein
LSGLYSGHSGCFSDINHCSLLKLNSRGRNGVFVPQNLWLYKVLYHISPGAESYSFVGCFQTGCGQKAVKMADDSVDEISMFRNMVRCRPGEGMTWTINFRLGMGYLVLVLILPNRLQI